MPHRGVRFIILLHGHIGDIGFLHLALTVVMFFLGLPSNTIIRRLDFWDYFRYFETFQGVYKTLSDALRTVLNTFGETSISRPCMTPNSEW